MSKLSVVLIYNKNAGGSLGLGELRRLFEKSDVPIDEAIPLEKGFEQKLKRQIAAKEAVVAVVGGDGTISAAAGLLAGTRSILLPLPGGTLNNFTKDLGVPQDVEDALLRTKNIKPRTVDVAEVNNVCFINNSSIGLYPFSVRARKQMQHIIGKWPAAFVAACRAVLRFRVYTVVVDGETFETPFIFVGNNNYRLKQPAGWSRDTLDEGVLSVYIAKTSSRLGMAKISIAALLGKHRQLDSFEYRKSKQITIKSSKHRSVHVSHDGEVATLETPLDYRVRQSSLRVIA